MIHQNKITINARTFECDIPNSQLINWLNGNDMEHFCAACEILSYQNTNEALDLLEPFLKSNDVYRCRYVLEVIFRLPNSKRLIPLLNNFLNSKNNYLVSTALETTYNYNLEVEEKYILNAIYFLGEKINSYVLEKSLELLSLNTHNYEILKTLYLSAIYNSSNKRAIGSILTKYKSSFFDEIFPLLLQSTDDNTRYLALKMAIDKKRQDLLYLFKDEKNGHIKKLYNKYK